MLVNQGDSILQEWDILFTEKVPKRSILDEYFEIICNQHYGRNPEIKFVVDPKRSFERMQENFQIYFEKLMDYFLQNLILE